MAVEIGRRVNFYFLMKKIVFKVENLRSSNVGRVFRVLVERIEFVCLG